jgi:hypothetical protein
MFRDKTRDDNGRQLLAQFFHDDVVGYGVSLSRTCGEARRAWAKRSTFLIPTLGFGDNVLQRPGFRAQCKHVRTVAALW